MSLTPGEERALAEIETWLRRSDPPLDAMLAHWTTKGAPRRPGWALLPWRHADPAEFARLALAVAGLIAVIALAVVSVLTTAPLRAG